VKCAIIINLLFSTKSKEGKAIPLFWRAGQEEKKKREKERPGELRIFW